MVGDCWIIIIVGVALTLGMLMTLANCNAARLPKSKVPLGWANTNCPCHVLDLTLQVTVCIWLADGRSVSWTMHGSFHPHI